MRIAALLSLLVALGATAAPAGVTVQPSSTGFKQAMDACPGALAGITFTLGHVRIAEMAGVSSDIDDTNPEAQVLVLTGAKGETANVVIDAKTHAVKSKHVKLSGKTVACVSAD